MTDTPELSYWERYALVSCRLHLPKLTYETLCEHADALHQARNELVRQIVIEWAMLQRAGAHPAPAACRPDEPPQWRKTHPWYSTPTLAERLEQVREPASEQPAPVDVEQIATFLRFAADVLPDLDRMRHTRPIRHTEPEAGSN